MERKVPSTKYFRCVVKNCAGRDNEHIQLFRIPDKDVEAWCTNLKIDIDSIQSGTRVCSRHFDPAFVGEKRLKSGARPTLFLGKLG